MGNCIIISGATASGKTDIAVKLCREFNGEIISADSRQVYRYMDIGTAKPDKEQQKSAKHHLINIVNPDDKFNVYDFYKLAQKKIKEIIDRKKIPFIVGGTGLYIRILKDGIFEEPISGSISRKEYESLNIEDLKKMLKEKDVSAYKNIDINNKRRVIRALEIIETTGKSITELWNKREKLSYDFIHLHLNIEKDILNNRITRRTKNMFKIGIVKETEKLIEMGYDTSLESMSGIGYAECVKYINGKYTLEEALEKTIIRTRQYAKRQRTWFRKEDKTDVNSSNDIIAKIENYIDKNKGNI